MKNWIDLISEAESHGDYKLAKKLIEKMNRGFSLNKLKANKRISGKEYKATFA